MLTVTNIEIFNMTQISKQITIATIEMLKATTLIKKNNNNKTTNKKQSTTTHPLLYPHVEGHTC